MREPSGEAPFDSTTQKATSNSRPPLRDRNPVDDAPEGSRPSASRPTSHTHEEAIIAGKEQHTVERKLRIVANQVRASRNKAGPRAINSVLSLSWLLLPDASAFPHRGAVSCSSRREQRRPPPPGRTLSWIPNSSDRAIMAATAVEQHETERVVARWVEDAVRSQRDQRRTKVRHPFVRPATICRGGFEVQAMCRDISNNGIGFLQADCPPKKGRHTISIWLKKSVIHAPVNIFWTQKIGDNWWACGGHLVISLIDSLRLHLDRRHTWLNNRRASKRISFCHSFTIESREADENAEPGDADDNFVSYHPEDVTPSIVSLDISTGGMRLISDELFATEGDIIQLRNSSRPELGSLRCRIASSFEIENGFYATGVTFLGT